MKKSVVVKMQQDFEARPIANLVQVANRYESKIYLEHGDSRVNAKSIMGMMSLALLNGEEKMCIRDRFMAYDIPCVIFCRDLKPDEMFLKIAEESNLPVFGTKRSTSEFMAELIYCLKMCIRDSLYGTSAEIAAALLLKNRPVYLTGCNVGILGQTLVDEKMCIRDSHPADENKMGVLQCADTSHQHQSGALVQAAGVPRVCRRT